METIKLIHFGVHLITNLINIGFKYIRDHDNLQIHFHNKTGPRESIYGLASKAQKLKDRLFQQQNLADPAPALDLDFYFEKVDSRGIISAIPGPNLQSGLPVAV